MIIYVQVCREVLLHDVEILGRDWLSSERIGDSSELAAMKECERRDFASNLQAKRDWTYNDTEILEVITQGGIGQSTR